MGDEKISFINSKKGIEITTVLPTEERVIIPGIEPFVDENSNFIGVVGLYSKNGFFSKETDEFFRDYRERFRWVYLTASGPYFYRYFRKIYKSFDAVATKDFCKSQKYANNLEMSFSMMARCGPEEDGFFYVDENKTYDFSILTWYGDKKAKAYYDAVRICKGLCKRGYKGIVVTQRGDIQDVKKDLGEYEHRGLIEIHKADYDGKTFRKIMGKAYVGIFPNILDAFPKHIIECLLDNKCIVISPKLIFGVDTLRELGKEITFVQDMRKKDATDNISKFIDQSRQILSQGSINPRDVWLAKYNFDNLSSQWAGEFNKLWGTNYTKVYLMRHINRFVNTEG